MKALAPLGSLALVVGLLALVPGCPNETDPPVDPETPLEPPPEGQGFQIQTGPQSVAAGCSPPPRPGG